MTCRNCVMVQTRILPGSKSLTVTEFKVQPSVYGSAAISFHRFSGQASNYGLMCDGAIKFRQRNTHRDPPCAII